MAWLKRATSKSIYTRENEALAKMLAEARRKRRVTQTDLAGKIERTQSWVAKVESGERLLDVVQFVRYARALGLNPGRLLDRLQKGAF